jgi:hypothetical protein
MSCITGLRVALLFVLSLSMCGSAEAKKKPEITGAIAASCGELVVLIAPASGAATEIETGPVGFLFPGPGGALFAPDVVNGRTTVYDMKTARVKEVVPGLTMPHFGPWRDRYLVVAGDLIVVSYPERSQILRMNGDFMRPWQVIQAPDTSAVLLLERYPTGSFSSRLTALDLVSRSIVMQREFEADITRIAVVGGAGLLAALDASAKRIRLLDPVTFQDRLELDWTGDPTDVAALDEGRMLVVAGANGALHRWKMKQGKKGLKSETLSPLPLEGRATRLAVAPDDRLLAVSTDVGTILVIDTKHKKEHVLGEWLYDGELRDLIWFDPNTRGPLIPTWSDQGGGPETLEKRW